MSTATIIKEQEIKLNVTVNPTDNLVVSDAAVPATVQVGRTFELSVPVTNNDDAAQSVSASLQAASDNPDGTEGPEEFTSEAGPTSVEPHSSINLTFTGLKFASAGPKDIDIQVKAE